MMLPQCCTVIAAIFAVFSLSVQTASGQSAGSIDTCRLTTSSVEEQVVTDAVSGFKYVWATQCGYSSTTPSVPSIEVRGTTHVSDAVLQKAARLTHLMVSFMSPTLFRRVAANVAVGIYYRRTEDPSVFPEYTPTPNCRTTCTGNCSLTCSDHGLPVLYEVAYGGRLVVVPAQNVECSSTNPNHYENLLVAEFSRSLYKYGLTESLKQKVLDANMDALSAWGRTIPVIDYFRQASLAWFQSTKLNSATTYGMNTCQGSALCPSEWFSRNNMKQKDNRLYDALNDIYNNDRAYIHGGVTLCDW
ncbi:uncharacterized protein LOC124277036 [Haliotis rubra]|uniref:uncharacterized protein LOC124277036 n=1 Tax=Haliotis rubra TaxID=36100 RepID=UPI001EE55391|nr:uncharacterized protein LOC124277036 [Haliotis rubra]XP_046568647.1 uncharacterized protein LOC124277036 [Haliotis rubra]XP_046568648.1 uncharacterized protein LOC124277036 [Haliotis rubra]